MIWKLDLFIIKCHQSQELLLLFNRRVTPTTADFILHYAIIDEFVKSQKKPFPVIPAKAGTQFLQAVTDHLDSGFHQSDDFQITKL